MASWSSGRGDGLWQRVDALIDSARNDGDLRSHRLEVLAARRFRATGRIVPPEFMVHERLAAIAAITAPRVLERIGDAYPRSAIVLKGPEVAALYPAPGMRNYGDIDVLVEEPEAAQSALIEAGFEPVGDPSLYVGTQHMRPLRPPDLPLLVEIHSRPWLSEQGPAHVRELFDTARPSITGVDGMLTLQPSCHVLMLAVHSWSHEPLRGLRDMVEIAAMAEEADRREIERLARRWGVQELWRTTARVIDAIFSDTRPPLVLRTWARNLCTARERNVLEGHLQRWLSDFSAQPLRVAARRLPERLLADLRPDGEEGWKAKLDRTALALRHASHPRSDHDLALSGRLESPHADEDA
jgi:hypothetical protein